MENPTAPSPSVDWQPLPLRGAILAALGNGVGLAVPLVIAGLFFSRVLADALPWPTPQPWLTVPTLGLLGLLLGGWIGHRRHRRVRWRLDDSGFALRRGNWWQNETHIPISRVQHLDLKHGPIERMLGLSTLVVHTAGTRMATVSVTGLDAGDAARLRDRLARQLDHDDAL